MKTKSGRNGSITPIVTTPDSFCSIVLSSLLVVCSTKFTNRNPLASHAQGVDDRYSAYKVIGLLCLLLLNYTLSKLRLTCMIRESQALHPALHQLHYCDILCNCYRLS